MVGALDFAFFSPAPQFRLFFFLWVFSWDCGLASRRTRMERLGFSGVILSEPLRPHWPPEFNMITPEKRFWSVGGVGEERCRGRQSRRRAVQSGAPDITWNQHLHNTTQHNTTQHNTTHNAQRTTHNAQRTTHNAQRTTHNATQHNAQHNTQHTNWFGLSRIGLSRTGLSRASPPS